MKGIKSGIAKDLGDFILQHVVDKVAANMETNFLARSKCYRRTNRWSDCSSCC